LCLGLVQELLEDLGSASPEADDADGDALAGSTSADAEGARGDDERGGENR
jgi:hypothetical protein